MTDFNAGAASKLESFRGQLAGMANPVRFAPGRARPVMSPVAIGSAMKTIGIAAVASLAAFVAVPTVTTTSTFRGERRRVGKGRGRIYSIS